MNVRNGSCIKCHEGPSHPELADDWRTWYRVSKDHANQKGVWNFFDPDADDESRPDLPTKPRVPVENEPPKMHIDIT